MANRLDAIMVGSHPEGAAFKRTPFRDSSDLHASPNKQTCCICLVTWVPEHEASEALTAASEALTAASEALTAASEALTAASVV